MPLAQVWIGYSINLISNEKNYSKFNSSPILGLKFPKWLDELLDGWTETRNQRGELCGGSQELEGVQRCKTFFPMTSIQQSDCKSTCPPCGALF